MRFGVALDLWCKGDPDFSPATPTRGHAEQGRRRDNGGRRQTEGEGAVAADRAPNQDALDELGSACDRHGYDRRSCGPMFAEWAEQQPPPGPTRRLIDAMADDIREFTKYLIAMATADPTGEAGSEVEGSEIPGDDGGAGAGDSAGAATGVAGTGEDGLRRESASPAAVDTEGGAPGSPAEVLGKPESDPERMF